MLLLEALEVNFAIKTPKKDKKSKTFSRIFGDFKRFRMLKICNMHKNE